MNSEYQAKKGFKTFLMTLSLSLVVFGAIYYFLTDPSVQSNIEEEPYKEETQRKVAALYTEEGNEENSAFGQLAAQEMDVPGRSVLAGEDTGETTESTVPETGVGGTTAALVISLTVLSFGGYILFLGPRRLAIARFERNSTKDL